MKSLHALFFDFDGVIVESAALKTEAYRVLGRRFPDVADAFVRYHIEHAGLSRYVKLGFLFDHLLKRSPEEGEIEFLAEEFAMIVRSQVVKAPFVPGAIEFLEWAHGRIPLYVVSGTPHAELLSIVRDRRLERFFREVRGFPAEKAPSIRDWLETSGFDPIRCLYVGDAISDFEAASAAGVPFVGRVTEENRSAFSREAFVKIPDLTGLRSMIENGEQ